jgi:tetratricopeptide (TPR) repeat protein
VGFRLRKSIQLAPGVRLNVSKTGLGTSFGSKYGRYSVHSSGRRTVSARTGIPGVYYQQSVAGGRQAGIPQQAAPEKSRKPGLFAPKAEKALYKAVKAHDIPAIRQVGDEEPDFQLASYSLAGVLLLGVDDRAEAKSLLEASFATGRDPAADPFIRKYLATLVLISIAEGITAELPVCRDAVGLALAELRQADGDVGGAIEVVEQLQPTTYSAVSLAELYLLASRPDAVIDLTDGLTNQDDATALLLVFRGAAFRQQGFHDAAHATLREALRARSRAAVIRHHALSERADNYLAQGKKGMARKDLERILAEDSDYGDVRERLAQLAQPG